MSITRRSLLLGATTLTPVALAGCGLFTAPAGTTIGTTPPPPPTVATIAENVLSDIQTFASGLLAAAPSLGGVKGIPANVVASVQTALKGIGTVAGQITTSTPVAAGQSSLQQIETLFNAAVQAVAPFVGLIPGVGQIFSAASILLPVIEGGVGLIANVIATPTPKPTVAMAGAAPVMTADQARMVLTAAAVGGVKR